MPTVVVGYALIYILLRVPLSDAINRFLNNTNKEIGTLTANQVRNIQTGDVFTQFLVGAVVIVALAYTIKIVEYALFKLKI